MFRGAVFSGHGVYATVTTETQNSTAIKSWARNRETSLSIEQESSTTAAAWDPKGRNARPKAESGGGVFGTGNVYEPPHHQQRDLGERYKKGSGWSPNRKTHFRAFRVQKMCQEAEDIVRSGFSSLSQYGRKLCPRHPCRCPLQTPLARSMRKRGILCATAAFSTVTTYTQWPGNE